MKQIFDKIESAGISIHEYEENNKICGYELNTYTNGGVNQIIFIDFRDTDKDPKNENDFKELFSARINSIDIDEEIEIHRQDKSYRENFTIRQGVKDFTDWKKSLLKLAVSLEDTPTPVKDEQPQNDDETRNKSLKWWVNLGTDYTKKLRDKYYPNKFLLTADERLNIYLSEIGATEPQPPAEAEMGEDFELVCKEYNGIYTIRKTAFDLNGLDIAEMTTNQPLEKQKEFGEMLAAAPTLYRENARLKELLTKIYCIENAAFGLKGFDVVRLKAEIANVLYPTAALSQTETKD